MVQSRVFRWARSTPYLAGLPREVAVLSFVAFAVALGYGIAAPAIPVYARTFGVSAFMASTVVSGFALMRLLTAGPAGIAVDRWGERRIMSLGIWIVALSSLASAAAQTFPQLLVLRGVGGIGSAMFTVSAMALLLRTTSAAQRGRATGAWQAGFLFGGIAGPAVGGLVIAISVRAPFVVYGVTLIVAGVIAARFLSGTLSAARASDPAAAAASAAGPHPAARATSSLRAAVRAPAYRAALAVNLSTGFVVFGLRVSIVPLYVTETLRLAVSWVGVGFLVAAAAQALALIPAGRRSDRSGRRGPLILGTCALGGSMLLLATGSGLISVLLAMAASGLASAFLGAAAGAVVGDVTRGQSGGRVVSVYQMVGDLGAIIGPLAAGALADALGYHWAFAAGVVIAALALVMVLLMPETLHRQSGPPDTATAPSTRPAPSPSPTPDRPTAPTEGDPAGSA